MQERRRLGRSRVLKSAKIIIGASSVVDCVVRNVTNGGARVDLDNTIDLPDAIDVTFDRGRTVRRARLAWRTLTAAGLQFVA
jgi:hypothetical protein